MGKRGKVSRAAEKLFMVGPIRIIRVDDFFHLFSTVCVRQVLFK